MGLLVLAFLPIVSSLLAGTMMLILGRIQRTNGELAAENGRRAANWGLTYLLITVGVWGGLIFTAIVFPDAPIVTQTYKIPPWPIMLWLIATVLQVVFSLVGLIVAAKRKVFRLPGIPFFRR